jgi:hypothetical protein
VARSGLLHQSQHDFSAGAYPQLDTVPANGLEDIVNGILEDDGSISRRGGGSYLGSLSTSSGQSFRNLWTGYLGVVGQVAVASILKPSVPTHDFYVRGVAQSDFVLGWGDSLLMQTQRPIASNGMVLFTYGSGTGAFVTAWGGSMAPSLTSQSLTLTPDSKTVTGTGTNFTASAPGALIQRPVGGPAVAVVESIQSDTSLTLFEPWGGPLVTSLLPLSQFISYRIARNSLPDVPSPVYLAPMFDRVLIGRGSRIAFTQPGFPFFVADTDYHQLPEGAVVLGMEPLRDQLLVFTTDGVYVISGLAFDLTDALGNVQQRVEQVAPDLVLWDNLGIAGWRGTVVAPCVDDVYLVDSVASMRPITGGMRSLYRSYVKAGYQLGQAAVYQSHYVLPVVNGDMWVDTLICDLRSGGWVRWDGAAGTLKALAVRLGDSTRQPGLWASSQRGRLMDLTGCFYPDTTNKSDPDGAQHSLRIETRTFTGGDLFKHQWRKARLRVEITGSATPEDSIRASYETGRVGSSSTVLSDPLIREGS